MDNLLRLAAVAVPAGLIASAVRKDNPSMALALVVGTAAVIMLIIASELTGVAESIRELADKAGLSNSALAAVMKALGISIVTRLVVDLMKDAGMSAAASAAELGGTVSGLWVTLPLMRTVLGMLEGLL